MMSAKIAYKIAFETLHMKINTHPDFTYNLSDSHLDDYLLDCICEGLTSIDIKINSESSFKITDLDLLNLLKSGYELRIYKDIYEDTRCIISWGYFFKNNI